ncbi:DUF2752 domain-containing protein [Streptomyces sp. NA04227]|uniref:DUF2752 domain-containing protein n=1 Tax=Streptomyces sp. NA04227 TaxID=2742136 RepID=UPI00159235B9|nr:DUF2752 domain-containing protein [Streptomyces sp. NA04227]QKW05947.1 DUF2752 domain-containing protein [Streptomyces sp. NA04227]
MNAETETAAAPGAGALVRRLLVPVGTLGAVVAAFGYVATVDPNEPGHYPVCPLLRFTGIYCPGCGGLRSAHAFAHGDLGAALTDNAFAVFGFGAFAVLWVLWTVRLARGRGSSALLVLRPAQMWVLGGLALVFTVVRNLPFGGWLHP